MRHPSKGKHLNLCDEIMKKEWKLVYVCLNKNGNTTTLNVEHWKRNGYKMKLISHESLNVCECGRVRQSRRWGKKK